jgi:hypothetical protein
MVHSYFDRAADALSRALEATEPGEQALLLDQALRLNRLALAEERQRLADIRSSPPSAHPPTNERDPPVAPAPRPPFPRPGTTERTATLESARLVWHSWARD